MGAERDLKARGRERGEGWVAAIAVQKEASVPPTLLPDQRTLGPLFALLVTEQPHNSFMLVQDLPSMLIEGEDLNDRFDYLRMKFVGIT